MQNILDATDLQPPYDQMIFPGKAEDEKILYVTREAPIVVGIRLSVFSLVVAIAMVMGAILLSYTGKAIGFETGFMVLIIVLLGGIVMFGGMWWIWRVFQKTMFIITTRRLTKFIHTTPWTRYQMSLGLDKVVDSAAYSKGYGQSILGLGTFVARSSAGNIKNFKIENIHFAEDLHNWMNKLMFVFAKETDKLDNFRPFSAKKIGERY
jgi:ABC-type nickel/cobalt efflux system permease component RcnA